MRRPQRVPGVLGVSVQSRGAQRGAAEARCWCGGHGRAVPQRCAPAPGGTAVALPARSLRSADPGQRGARSPRAGCGAGVVSAGTPGLCLCVGATGKRAVPCAPLLRCGLGGAGGVLRTRNIPGSRGGSRGQLRGMGGAPVAVFVVGKWWLFSRGVSQLKRRDLHVIWVQGWGRSRATRDSREPLASGPRRSAVTAGRAAPSAGTSRGSSFPASCVCAVNK